MGTTLQGPRRAYRPRDSPRAFGDNRFKPSKSSVDPGKPAARMGTAIRASSAVMVQWKAPARMATAASSPSASSCAGDCPHPHGGQRPADKMPPPRGVASSGAGDVVSRPCRRSARAAHRRRPAPAASNHGALPTTVIRQAGRQAAAGRMRFPKRQDRAPDSCPGLRPGPATAWVSGASDASAEPLVRAAPASRGPEARAAQPSCASTVAVRSRKENGFGRNTEFGMSRRASDTASSA